MSKHLDSPKQNLQVDDGVVVGLQRRAAIAASLARCCSIYLFFQFSATFKHHEPQFSQDRW